MRDTQRERETERQRDRDTGRAGREGSRLLRGNPMWDSILGPWDHAEQKADAPPLSHAGVPGFHSLNVW